MTGIGNDIAITRPYRGGKMAEKKSEWQPCYDYPNTYGYYYQLRL
jgi:hypothetical protein